MYTGNVVAIRPLEPEDLPVLTKLANDPEVRQLVVGWDWPVSESGQVRWLESTGTSPATRRLAVIDRQTGQTIGLTGLWEIDWHNRSALTAVKLDATTAPQGAGSDTIMLVNAWAFYEVGLHRLWGSILDFNAASYHAYVRKCGWRLEGIERQAIRRVGAWADLYRVAILRSDFDAHPLAAKYIRMVCPLDPTPFERPDDGLPR
jgi:RimJ/RimL family protein N-acetyltransferase